MDESTTQALIILFTVLKYGSIAILVWTVLVWLSDQYEIEKAKAEFRQRQRGR